MPSVCEGHRKKALTNTKQMEKVKINLYKECENRFSFSFKNVSKLNNAFIPVC